MSVIWNALILVAGGLILLRLGGRKSISQMSVAETIVMLSIGAIIVAPLASEGVMKTLLAAGVFILFLVIVEYLGLKFNFFEKLVTGKSVIVLKDGKPDYANLAKLRITVDNLEMRLRQKGIASFSDVKMGTIETNGELGYELMPHAKPLTLADLEKWFGDKIQKQPDKARGQQNLFTEVEKQGHEQQHPPYLQ
ncbi:MAG TPA: YetF domain-containing protein [Bacillota bacterium]|nr:YetF domain-containing protein [Bacillota bacterium]